MATDSVCDVRAILLNAVAPETSERNSGLATVRHAGPAGKLHALSVNLGFVDGEQLGLVKPMQGYADVERATGFDLLLHRACRHAVD